MRRTRAWAVGLVAALSLAFLSSMLAFAPGARWLWAVGLALAALTGILLFYNRDHLPDRGLDDGSHRPNDQLGTASRVPSRDDELRRGEVDDANFRHL